jgi:uncharacterized protein YbjT (DUF2867 family)
MKQKKVLLAGANGYLGRFIAAELVDQGYPARLIVRDPNTAGFDKNHFDVIKADVTEPSNLEGLCNNINVVISTVGITRQKDGLTYMDVDYQANLNLLQEAMRAGVGKFLYVSAFNAEHLTHLKMAAAKELFVERLEKSGMDYCILRPNGFYSDITEFLKMAKKGKVNLFGDGNFRMNPIHGADLAEVCVKAIETEDKTIEIGGPEVFTHNEIATLAFKVLDKKPQIKYMPEWMRKAILGLTRTFTSSKTYGPMEFFFTVMAMDMVAPTYGKYTLKNHFSEILKSKQ